MGTIIGGLTIESRIWRAALMQLSRDISQLREQLESELNINVEFHVPGHILAPEFQGIRTGTFRKADRHLKIQVSVPVHPPEDPYACAVKAMREAIGAVVPWSQRRHIAFDPEPFLSLLAQLESKGRPMFSGA